LVEDVDILPYIIITFHLESLFEILKDVMSRSIKEGYIEIGYNVKNEPPEP